MIIRSQHNLYKKCLGWDADNRLTSLTNGSNSATYAYNGSGLRASKTKNGTTKAFLTDGDSPASALLSDGDATYVPGVSERRGSTTNPFHFDLLGSLRAVSNSGGTATSEATLYEAFGNVVTGDTDWAGQTASRPFGFVGGEQYQSDSESGLQLLGNRYYDPTIGRFLSSDPAEDGDNWYAYVDNSPNGFVDPEGLDIGTGKLDIPVTPNGSQGNKKYTGSHGKSLTGTRDDPGWLFTIPKYYWDEWKVRHETLPTDYYGSVRRGPVLRTHLRKDRQHQTDRTFKEGVGGAKRSRKAKK